MAVRAGASSAAVSHMRKIWCRGLSRISFVKTLDLNSAEKPQGLSLVDLSLGAVASGCKSQAELVQALKKNGVLKNDLLAAAMAETDRAIYIPIQQDKAVYAEPYENVPVTIHALAKSTMSTPHHHSMTGELCGEYLEAARNSQRKSISILDAGCGTGYTAAVLARMALNVGLEPRVVGTDSVPSLVEAAKEIQENKLPEVIAEKLEFRAAFDEAEEELRTFDLIHGGFAVPDSGELLVDLLEKMLRPGGRFVGSIASAESGIQELVHVDKCPVSGELTKTIVLRPVHCQQMMNNTFDESSASMSHAEKLEQVKRSLDAWKLSFERDHGHPPSKSDLLSSPLFQEFADLRKRSWDK